MPIMDDPYSQLAARFVEHYTSLRGAVRHALVSRQVDAHLSPPPSRIVDVGGGAGHQAIRLAGAGYDVVLLDPSPKMLGLAREALAAGPPEVRRRIELVVGDGESAPDLLGRGSFDGVLCHGVLPYVEDPVPLIRALATLARPGGRVSVLAKNQDALAMRPALEGRFGDALAAFEADRDIGGVGIATRGDTVAGLRAAFDAAGIDLANWYGVRLFTDPATRKIESVVSLPRNLSPVDMAVTPGSVWVVNEGSITRVNLSP
jgi:S-adenosylmethionine-dependent methyltransferase